jgi:hypothetical protein
MPLGRLSLPTTRHLGVEAEPPGERYQPESGNERIGRRCRRQTAPDLIVIGERIIGSGGGEMGHGCANRLNCFNTCATV